MTSPHDGPHHRRCQYQCRSRPHRWHWQQQHRQCRHCLRRRRHHRQWLCQHCLQRQRFQRHQPTMAHINEPPTNTIPNAIVTATDTDTNVTIYKNLANTQQHARGRPSTLNNAFGMILTLVMTLISLFTGLTNTIIEPTAANANVKTNCYRVTSSSDLNS